MKKVGIIIIIVPMALFALQKIGHWLGMHLTSAIYAAKIGLTYGEKLSENVHYEQEFKRFIDEKYADDDFMDALDSIAASFTTIWITGVTAVPLWVAMVILLQQIRLYSPESVTRYVMLAGFVLEATAVVLNALIIIREVRRIIKTYRDVVFKEFVKADIAGEKRKAEMATLTR